MNDLRSAVRSIASHRWFSLAIVVTLAIGIGINTTVFTLSSAVLFKPLPYKDSDRLFIVGGARVTQTEGGFGLSYADYLDLRGQAQSFEQLEAAGQSESAVIGESGRGPERYRLTRVTSGFFKVFRVEPVAGRGLTPADEHPSAPLAAVIGHSVWRSRYNLSGDVIGRQIRLNQEPATIVGVMPEGFGLPELEEIWIPLGRGDRAVTERTTRDLFVFGLLKPGTELAAARAEVSGIAARLRIAHPDTNKDIDARVRTFHERFVGGKANVMFSLMLGAVGLVLLIACANVANMMLGRGIGRAREITIRSALGASRWRIVRQLLVESLLLSAAGGLAGLVIAVLAVPAFDRAMADAQKPSWIVFAVDYTVLAYTAGLCILSALAFGLVPAWRASRVDLTRTLNEGGRGGSGRVGWLSSSLVVVQFAFAVVLLTASGLLVRSFIEGALVNGWVPADRIMTARVELPRSRYADPDARVRFFDEVQARLKAIPGVVESSVTSGWPGTGAGRPQVEVEGETYQNPDDRPSTIVVTVSPSYFKTIDLRVIRGRGFESRDGAPGAEAAIVTRTFVDRHWPGQSGLDKHVRQGRAVSDPWLTVVGITDEIVQSTQASAPDAMVFVPLRQQAPSSMILAVRSSGDAAPLASAMRETVEAMDPDLALFELQTAERRAYIERWPYRVFGAVFGVFATFALLMAAVGLYGVMAQSTVRRTREIGIRMAIGATPRRILTDVVRRGAVQLGIGLVLGFGGAFAITEQMRSLLLGVLPRDPAVFSSAAAVLLVVGLIACWLPARRAAHIAPVRALADGDRAG